MTLPKSFYVAMLLVVFIKTTASCQVSDSLIAAHDSIPEIIIEAYNAHQDILQTAGGISKTDSTLILRNNGVSLLPSLNTVAGVMMESRGDGGSPLISIRGSLLRDPFAIRNIKVYWNGMPMTSPDGTTTIEVIDPGVVSNIEIIKGPAGSLYGGGTGGVMLFETSPGQAGTKLAFTGGSYGLLKTSVAHTFTGAAYNISASFIHGQYDGYRQQEWNKKDELVLNGVFHLTPKTTLSLLGYIYNGGWGLPGSLTMPQVSANPQQAVAFSKKIDALIARATGRIGMNLDQLIGHRTDLNIAMFTGTSDKENPYGTSSFYNGYKYEFTRTIGTRNVLTIHLNRVKVTAGMEMQGESDFLREHVDLTGQPGNVKSAYTTNSLQTSFFAQAGVTLPLHFFLTGGISDNLLTYDHRYNGLQGAADHSGSFSFRPDIIPRIALVKTFSQALSVHGSISYGFSQPDALELIDPYGVINTSLQSENGINYEVGSRVELAGKNLFIDVTGYIFQLNNIIIPSTDTSGYTSYHNTGTTSQKGIEGTINYVVIKGGRIIRQIRTFTTATLNNYKFNNYVQESVNYAGKILPGIPGQVWTAGIDVSLWHNIYVYATYKDYGRVFLDNRNRYYQSPYQLLDIKLGYDVRVSKKIKATLYAGGNNLLNTQYTSFFQLNDANNRFYNPAAGRNYFAGLTLFLP